MKAQVEIFIHSKQKQIWPWICQGHKLTLSGLANANK